MAHASVADDREIVTNSNNHLQTLRANEEKVELHSAGKPGMSHHNQGELKSTMADMKQSAIKMFKDV